MHSFLGYIFKLQRLFLSLLGYLKQPKEPFICSHNIIKKYLPYLKYLYFNDDKFQLMRTNRRDITCELNDPTMKAVSRVALVASAPRICTGCEDVGDTIWI